MAAAGLVLAVVMIPLTYYCILSLNQSVLIEGINIAFNFGIILIGFSVIWVLKCNKVWLEREREFIILQEAI